MLLSILSEHPILKSHLSNSGRSASGLLNTSAPCCSSTSANTPSKLHRDLFEKASSLAVSQSSSAGSLNAVEVDTAMEIAWQVNLLVLMLMSPTDGMAL